MGGSYSLAFERLATFVAIHGSLLITARPTTLQPSGLRPNQANGCRPVPKDFKMIPFLGRAMPKARKPHQGHDYGPAIDQIDGQSFLAYLGRLSARCLYVNGQRTHTRPWTVGIPSQFYPKPRLAWVGDHDIRWSV